MLTTLVPSTCSFATDRQRFDPVNLPPYPASELWFQTTCGNAVSRGFVMRDADNAVIDEARRLMAEAPADATGPVTTYYLVTAGSYDGWPEPVLAESNRIEPYVPPSERTPAYNLREARAVLARMLRFADVAGEGLDTPVTTADGNGTIEEGPALAFRASIWALKKQIEAIGDCPAGRAVAAAMDACAAAWLCYADTLDGPEARAAERAARTIGADA